jgi:acyl dehydratase
LIVQGVDGRSEGEVTELDQLLDDLRRLEGRRYPPIRGADPVTAPDLRRFMEVLEWDEPIHRDPEAARAAGLPDVVAPASAAPAFAMAPYWSPGEPPATPTSPPLFPDLPFMREFEGPVEVFNGAFARESSVPLVLGDRLSATWQVGSHQPKHTRVGPGAFLEVIAEYAREDGTVVSRGRFTLFLYVPAPGSAPRPPDEGRRTPSELGFAITHTRQRMAMWVSANRDFAPIHLDTDYARNVGAPDIFANTFFIEALYERLLRSLAGPTGAIDSISFRMHTFLCPAPTVEVLGEVVEDAGEGGTTRVSLRQIADGVVTSSGEGLIRR